MARRKNDVVIIHGQRYVPLSRPKKSKTRRKVYIPPTLQLALWLAAAIVIVAGAAVLFAVLASLG